MNFFNRFYGMLNYHIVEEVYCKINSCSIFNRNEGELL